MNADTLADLDTKFQQIADNFAVIDLSAADLPDKNRITVVLDLPYLQEYDRPTTVELVYGCNFMVAIGDMVSCPPTPRFEGWTTGVVTALNGGSYRGPVKNVRKVKKA